MAIKNKLLKCYSYWWFSRYKYRKTSYLNISKNFKIASKGITSDRKLIVH